MSNQVVIKVTGRRSIVPTTFTAVARKDESWYDFLAKNGLQLTAADGVYVRTTHLKYELGRAGFSGKLNEQVGTFFDKFKRKKGSYTVRLMKGKPAPVVTSKVASNVVRRQNSRSTAGRGVTLNRPSTLMEGDQSEERVSPPEVDGDEVEDDEDNMSVMTCGSQDEREHRGNGVQIDDLKTPAGRQLDKIQNRFLLRACQEIRKLKEKNLWVRNYQRAPLSCYLVELILNP